LFELRKNNTPFILGVGKLSPRKNFISVLKAFNAIKDKIEHQLVIVGGNGWDFQEIEKVIIELDLNKRVELLGYVTDEYLVPLYQNASVFVYPSKFEGFGLTILEAMACGCPVITSNITSPPEVAGNAAILIDPNSHEELAEAIFSVCDNRVKVNEMVEMGLQRAVQFSWTDCATSMIEIYETL
jgi:glycosyltransferase involved in cell wall biosynthesis